MLYGLPPFYSRNTSEMYYNILHKPLKLRSTVSENAQNILAHVRKSKIVLNLSDSDKPGL